MFLRLINKRQKLICFSFLFVLLWQLQLPANPLTPICIYFPGNFAGNEILLSDNHEPMPGSCWKAPAVLNSFTDNKSFKHIIAGPGNNFCVYKPVSFLSDGKFAGQIINDANPHLQGVSAQDLLLYRSTELSAEARNKLLSNLEPTAKGLIFPDYYKHSFDNINIWFFNFIELEQLKKLPLQNWGEIKPENPSRALRRISPNFNDHDISVSFAHLSQIECFKLAEEFNNFPGHHIIVQVASKNTKAEFSLYEPESHGNAFIFSINDGHLRLPFVKIRRHSNGHVRLTVRRIPYLKAETGNSLKSFRAIRNELGKYLYETLNLVPTQIQASTTPFRFKPQLYAQFVKSYMRTDFAMLFPPDEKFKTDNVISAVQCLSAFANEKLHKGQVSGKRLYKLLTETIKKLTKLPVFSGISFQIFAGRPQKIKINRANLEPEISYSFSVNQRMQEVLESLALLDREDFEPFDGITLWDVWKTQLKSLRIKRTHLLEP